MSDIDELINLIDEMADDITRQVREAKEKALIEKLPAMLKENGVNLCITECRCEGNSVDELRFVFGIDRLDFSERDKVFEDKIAELDRMRIVWLDKAVEWQQENEKLNKRIAELESKESVKPMRIEFHADNGEMLTPLEVANSLINQNAFKVDELKELAEILEVYYRHHRDKNQDLDDLW